MMMQWLSIAHRLRNAKPPSEWRWRCLECGNESAPPFGDRPECIAQCEHPAYVSMIDHNEPSERPPQPDPHGDAEDRVIYLTAVHGGTVKARQFRVGGPPVIVVWVPPGAKT